MKAILVIISVLALQYASGTELFIKINRSGMHYAVIGNQTQYNPSNVFRFFDLNQGNAFVQVIDQNTGQTVVNTSVQIMYGQRLVLEFDAFGAVVMQQNIPIQPINWYTSNTTNSNFGSGLPQIISTDAFPQFLQQLDQESFDSKKLDISKKYVDKTMLTASQIAEIAKKYEFDSYRLDWAKHAYKRCIDPANYFLLKPIFTFQSNYHALEKYVEEN
jgi:hypothetical protein